MTEPQQEERNAVLERLPESFLLLARFALRDEKIAQAGGLGNESSRGSSDEKIHFRV